jgi:hypothetical protein
MMLRLSILLCILATTPLALGQEKTESLAASSSANKAAELTFDDLKFEIGKHAKFERKMLTPKIESYAGKQIKISGYILPASVFQREGIKKFVLLHQDFELCKDPWPSTAQQIWVEMEGEATASFTTKRITVEGEFSIKEMHIVDGRSMAIYHLKATSAK